MSGLTRFAFFPRDWLSGTRALTLNARGAYIDLLAAMYDHGGPIDYDVRWLCRFLGLRDSRQLDPVLKELIEAGKIVMADGKLSNPRAMREIEAAKNRIAAGKTGGRLRKKGSVRTAHESHENATSEAPASYQQASSTQVHDACYEENQAIRKNPPSPSPSTLEKNTPVRGAPAPQNPPPEAGKTITPEKRFFDRGKSVLGKKTGGTLNKLKTLFGVDEAARLIERAAEKQDPREWIGAVLRNAERDGVKPEPEIDPWTGRPVETMADIHAYMASIDPETGLPKRALAEVLAS